MTQATIRSLWGSETMTAREMALVPHELRGDFAIRHDGRAFVWVECVQLWRSWTD